MAYGQPGSFLGMTFNGLHSAQLGITRTSSSNRHTKELTPAMKDFTVDKPNGDGQYWFGATYTKRTFNVSFAFDRMDNTQYEKLKKTWCDRKIHELIFDEEPYKVWSAKITSQSLKVVPFDEYNEATNKYEVIYKGEGSFTFTCYFPFARSRYECLDDYAVSTIPEWRDPKDYNADASKYAKAAYLVDSDGRIQMADEDAPTWKGVEFLDVAGTLENSANAKLADEKAGSFENKEEWAASSNLPTFSSKINYGDLPMPFIVTYGPYETTFTGGLKATLRSGTNSLSFDIKNVNDDTTNLQNRYIRVDMYKGVIEGLDADKKPTGFIYNNCITSGDFFLVSVGQNFDAGASGEVEYHYWYL